MLQNYLKTAFRNLIKQRFYSIINIAGLAVGTSCCLLIVLFVIDEVSYDKHHEYSERIYRIAGDFKFQSMERKIAVMSAPMADALVADYPEVIAATRFRERGSFLVKVNEEDENVKEFDVIYADNDMFDVFSFDILEGDPQNALTEPNTVVISQSAAERYFPEDSPINQMIIVNNGNEHRVTAVVKDMPSNSHFHFDFFFSMETLDESKQPVWVSHNFQTYVLLAAGADAEAFNAKLPGLVEKYVGPQLQQFMQIDLEKFEEQGNYMHYYIQPLTDIHLKSDLLGEFEANGDIAYVYIFAAVALFILIIACINFMNLSTARSANRAKEVGVRKVLGSHKSFLVNQFLIESIIVSILAFSIAIILAEVFLPTFNNLSGKALEIPFTHPFFILAVGIGAILVGIMAGIYPAFFLSSFQPVHVLKGKLSAGANSGLLRSGLVVFQFVTSIVLIIGTVVVQRQLGYIQNKKVGFDREQVMILQDTYVMRDQTYSFKEEMLNLPEITKATVSNFMPVEGFSTNNTSFWPEGDRSEESQIIMQNWRVDHDYIKTLGMEIVEGRDFSREYSTDSMGVILNESAVKNLGFDDPIGERIQSFAGFGPPAEGEEPPIATFTVVGVVKDFHFESMKENIESLGLFIGRSTASIAMKVRSDDMASTINKIETKWGEFAPGQPFAYQFLDERFDRMYRAEQRTGKIFSIFAGLAIFVACLGLFALAAFMAEQRKKEIGIRKVLGATVPNIVILLTKDFTKLILLALVFAIPLAWWASGRWLENYSYRIDVSWDIFAIAGLAAIFIAWLTISYQSFNAAVNNPVESLRDE